MGWEYGMKSAESATLPEVVKRLASALTFNERYSLERHANGFILVRDDPAWPKALEVWGQPPSGLDEVADGEAYIYCLFHIWGEEGRIWREQMEEETRKNDGLFTWFELD
ncbi:hypothetical protein ACX93W_09280 [Paenibacillus sp. CAU 1782]